MDVKTPRDAPAMPPLGAKATLAELERRFDVLAQSIQNPTASSLLGVVFAKDGPLWCKFRDVPAAKFFHEAYQHGLLEHTVQVAEAVSKLASQHEGVDQDIAVAGALLHDIGKIHTYGVDDLDRIDVTAVGRLEGHIVAGYQELLQAEAALADLDQDDVSAIRHIVLSHHGQLAHGSPVVPLTREAVLVHQMDHLCAMLGSFDRVEAGLKPSQRWGSHDRGIGGCAHFPKGARAFAAGAAPLPPALQIDEPKLPHEVQISDAARTQL